MKTSPGAAHSAHVPEWLPLLAAAIVQQALSDAFDRSLPPAVRREARRFLAGSPEYRFWGQVADGQSRH
jgi:hypothetical protein